MAESISSGSQKGARVPRFETSSRRELGDEEEDDAEDDCTRSRVGVRKQAGDW
jgi:hypothetical protein